MQRLVAAGWSMRMARKRVAIGKQITQWRKSLGRTVATASAAPGMIADLQRQLDAANERVEELEEMNDLLTEELDSLRQHEEEMEEDSGSSFEGFESDASMEDPQADDAPASDANGDAMDNDPEADGASVPDAAGESSESLGSTLDGLLRGDPDGDEFRAAVGAWLASGPDELPSG